MKNLKSFFLILIVLLTVTFSNFTFTKTNATNTTIEETNIQTNQFLEQFYRNEDEKNRKKIKTPNPFFTTIKVLFYLFILGGGGFLLVRWFIKKTSIPQSEDSQFVEVILTKMIGLNAYIHVVKILNEYYILSQSNELRLIEKITNKETIDFIELNKEKMKPKDSKFIDILGNIPSFKKIDKFEFLKSQKEKLKKF